MLFFIDESWQVGPDGKSKIGVLAAVQLKSHDFNECSTQIFKLKTKHLGLAAGNVELKGNNILREYLFKLETEKNIISKDLSLVRELMEYMQLLGVNLFGSVTFEEREIDLACADVSNLERPFFFLFERIDLFMKENHPGMMATLIFDDRGIQFNKKISASVSNFFHKSAVGKGFNNIIRVPCFALSGENVGLQMADIVAYIIGGQHTRKVRLTPFFQKLKEMEFKSRSLRDVGGKQYCLLGFKVINKKEAGDKFDSGRVL